MFVTEQKAPKKGDSFPGNSWGNINMSDDPFVRVVPPVSKSKEELVLELIAHEARLLEQKKADARVLAKAQGMTDAEIEALVPPHPAGTFRL